jgi:DNA polymerase III subunit delta
MAAENALAFLRGLGAQRPVAPLVVIAGPQAFLREYLLDRLRERLAPDGFQYRSFQVGGGDNLREVLAELDGADLFAPRRLLVCRLTRAYRERTGDDVEEADGRSGPDVGGEAALAAAAERLSAAVRLVVVCERDNAPAKLRRVAEHHGVLVNCARPFDNQLGQYAEFFARNLGLRLAASASDLLAARHGSDLAATANAISRAAILAADRKTLDTADFGEQGATRVPDLFELADAIARGSANESLALFDRAIQTGRDPIELLAVEVIPLLRRMLVAASLLAARQGQAAIAGALGFAPASTMVARAVDGARSFGLERLRAAHRRACELDERFKSGLIKERDAAVAGLLVDLLASGR